MVVTDWQMSAELAAMGPGASGNGVSTMTVPRSAPGPGVSLHAYDIAVLVVYFVFVIGVGVWVSSLEVGGWGRDRLSSAADHRAGGRGGQKAGYVWEAQGPLYKDIKGGSPSQPFHLEMGN